MQPRIQDTMCALANRCFGTSRAGDFELPGQRHEAGPMGP